MQDTNQAWIGRQGDVLIVAVDDIPKDAVEVPRTKRGVVLAEGQITGHAHRIPSRSAKLYRTEMDAQFMRVTAPVELSHEEHKTRCALCGPKTALAVSIAVARLDGGYDASAYRCAAHATAEKSAVVKLDDPGATVVPPGRHARIIHTEYMPGELPRQVAD